VAEKRLQALASKIRCKNLTTGVWEERIKNPEKLELCPQEHKEQLSLQFE
jgi:hypothetical protein